MTDPPDPNETVGVPSTDPNETVAQSSTPADSLDAGLAAGFGRPANGPAQLTDLRTSLGPLRPVLLKEAEGESTLVVKPNSDAMPSKADAGDRYQLSGEIARGGMGAILRGRDVDLGRDLAVKVLLQKYADRPEVARRFIEEAQIGGQLQHPGVVPVYDIGRFGELPYFTMKLVKGQTLAAILGERTEETEDRPRLLGIALQVAQAMAYAHAKGVIHRDLKPANIMVGAFGEVQVMDWGLAKVLAEGGVADEERASRAHQTPEDVTTIRTARSTGSHGSLGTDTEAGSIMGTPAYMPPEQASGDIANLDRRADVFALGAILCEILTGKPPYVGRSGEEVRRKAANGDLADATARLDACGADHELVGLTKTCLAPEPIDRPKDAQAVAEGLSAYLTGVQDRLRQAELARAAADARTAEERRKRKWQLGLAASVAAFTLMGAVGLSIFASIVQGKNRDLANANSALSRANTDLDQQRTRAEEREQQAIAAVKRFGDVVKDEPLLKDTPELESLRKKLLQEPLAFFKTLRDQLEADNDTRPESLSRLASAAFDLGNITNEIGDKEDARRAYEAARAIFQKLADAHPTVTEYQNNLASSHLNLGSLLSSTGQTTEARRAYDAAIAIQQTLADAHPTVTEYQSNLALSHNSLGNLLSETGQPAEARRAYVAALAIQQKLADAHPSVTDYQDNLAGSHLNLGVLLRDTGQRDEARRAWEAALAIQQTLADAHPTLTEYQRGLAMSHNNLGNLLSDTGKPADARRAYDAAIAIKQRLADAHPTVTEYQSNLGSSHHNLGILLSETGQPVEARRAYEAALAIQQTLADAHPSVSGYQSALADSHISLGRLLSQTGQPTEARRAYEAALAIQQTLTDAHPTVTGYQSDLASSHLNLGILLSETGQPTEARRAFDAAIAIQQKLADAHPSVTDYQSDLANSHNNLGLLLSETGQPAEARRAYDAAIAIRQTLADAHPTVNQYQSDLAMSHNNLGLLLSETGQPTEARRASEAALAIQQTLADAHPESPDYASNMGATLNNLALIDLGERRFDEARAHLKQAIIWQKKALATNPRNPTYRQFLKNHLSNLIEAATALGNDAEAAEAQRELADLAASDPAQAALNARLAAVIGGEAPRDNAERLALAQQAYDSRHYATAARLWGEALEANPKLADTPQNGHRYNAACSAALADATQGDDAAQLDDDERARLRQQALEWLKQELATWTYLLESATPEQRQAIAQTLSHWQQDTDLASIRDEAALAKLPDAEREPLQTLWTEVDSLLQKAGKP